MKLGNFSLVTPELRTSWEANASHKSPHQAWETSVSRGGRSTRQGAALDLINIMILWIITENMTFNSQLPDDMQGSVPSASGRVRGQAVKSDWNWNQPTDNSDVCACQCVCVGARRVHVYCVLCIHAGLRVCVYGCACLWGNWDWICRLIKTLIEYNLFNCQSTNKENLFNDRLIKKD